MAKENSIKIKRKPTVWENIFANDTWDKGLISKIYKELTRLHSRKTNNPVKKEGAYTLCKSMDGTGEHYAKWNKPDGEGQIPYDLTFNWNIINRKKKSKQNITRDIEVKNNLTIARGDWGGDSVERGFQKLL